MIGTRQFDDTDEALEDWDEMEASQWTKYKLYLWLFFEEPFVSPTATGVSLAMVVLIFLAMFLQAVEQQYDPRELDVNEASTDSSVGSSSTLLGVDKGHTTSRTGAWDEWGHTKYIVPTERQGVLGENATGPDFVQFGIVIFFTLEVILRFAIAPKRGKFFTQPHNVGDILAILPYRSLIDYAKTPI